MDRSRPATIPATRVTYRWRTTQGHCQDTGKSPKLAPSCFVAESRGRKINDLLDKELTDLRVDMVYGSETHPRRIARRCPSPELVAQSKRLEQMRLPVVGVLVDYSDQQGAILVDRDTFKELGRRLREHVSPLWRSKYHSSRCESALPVTLPFVRTKLRHIDLARRVSSSFTAPAKGSRTSKTSDDLRSRSIALRVIV
jgi:hypothetical protein